ncbi:fibroblast growth factor 4A [Pygocentrus nattereri]|uniref:fibroblast growth factor 4A n=1 Tax=Pygocentrus nattereri TaxID=42514 RepID=UPI001891E749|nr:fibroblast growth factor 4A [Pygocentrus nattereri]
MSWWLTWKLCNGVDTDAGLTLDQANQLRHMWLLSIKESKLKEQALSQSHPDRTASMQQLLYCRVGIGYHLQILTNGSVRGVHEPTEHSWLKVFAMKRGVVGIRGVKSELYLCMNKEGIAQGMKQFSPDCLFKENLEENYYTTYSSATHPGLYLALSQRGQLRRGNTVGPQQACTHFLPRKTQTN